MALDAVAVPPRREVLVAPGQFADQLGEPGVVGVLAGVEAGVEEDEAGHAPLPLGERVEAGVERMGEPVGGRDAGAAPHHQRGALGHRLQEAVQGRTDLLRRQRTGRRGGGAEDLATVNRWTRSSSVRRRARAVRGPGRPARGRSSRGVSGGTPRARRSGRCPWSCARMSPSRHGARHGGTRRAGVLREPPGAGRQARAPAWSSHACSRARVNSSTGCSPLTPYFRFSTKNGTPPAPSSAASRSSARTCWA